MAPELSLAAGLGTAWSWTVRGVTFTVWETGGAEQSMVPNPFSELSPVAVAVNGTLPTLEEASKIQVKVWASPGLSDTEPDGLTAPSWLRPGVEGHQRLADTVWTT